MLPDTKNLFQNEGKVVTADTFDQGVKKIQDALTARTNKVVQRNMLLSNFPQGRKTFDRWYQDITNTARLIDYDNYDWKQAAVDAIILQTTNSKLRERALQDNLSYDDLIRIGIAKEQSVKGAAMLEQASGYSGPKVKLEENHHSSKSNRNMTT